MTEDEVDIEFAHIVKPPRTVAYRIGYAIGYAIGIATLAVPALALLTLAGIGLWTVLR